MAVGRNASGVALAFDSFALLAARIAHAPISDARIAIKSIGLTVSVFSSKVMASFDTSTILGTEDLDRRYTSRITVEIPTSIAAYGHEPRLRLEPIGNNIATRDERLVELIARAFSIRNELLAMNDGELAAMAVTKLRHLQRTARLSYLDPTIIRAVLNGTQPYRLSARELWRMAELPLSWASQCEALGLPTT